MAMGILLPQLTRMLRIHLLHQTATGTMRHAFTSAWAEQLPVRSPLFQTAAMHSPTAYRTAARTEGSRSD